jgi:hypothetical protein
MPSRKLIVFAVLAAILGSTAACADVTGPTQKTQFCQVSNGSGTCQD